jgi:glycosyltransferase involved in cell wall biosynthesis
VTTERPGWRPGADQPPVATPAGVRVVIDLRPLQDPERAPLTASYLEGLLDGLADDPRPGESFAPLLAADLPDPSDRWPRLDLVATRMLPPTRLLRSGALTVDPFVLRGASIGAGWRADRHGASGTVYHAAAGGLPIASGIPVIAALLDLAPWSMPEAYQSGTVARFGQRLRRRLLRDADLVLVPSRATAEEARLVLRVRRARLRVIPLAARPSFRPEAVAGAARERERLGLAARYVVYAGRYDARQDLPTLFAALSALAEEAPAPNVSVGLWPPRVCLVGATPGDRAAVSRAAARAGLADAIAYAPRLPDDRLAALVAGARMLVQPVRSEASGIAALDALAAGVPVVASAVGALPEVVGGAGILVEPGDAARLATAIRAVWSDDGLHAGLVEAALARPARERTWSDVARETREAWAEVAREAPML